MTMTNNNDNEQRGQTMTTDDDRLQTIMMTMANEDKQGQQ